MNPIGQLAASALPGMKKYILFAGAGVSKDAGVPTAWDLMLQTANYLYCADGLTASSEPSPAAVESWFVGSSYANRPYSELIGTLYPTTPEQQEFLGKFLDGKCPGDSHKLIAQLARLGIIRAVITTNFDNYIERALESIGLKIQVISNDEDLQHAEPLIQCHSIRVYKPHGTLGRGALRNTPKDLRQLSPLMEDELVRVLSEHGVIVLGYAGADPGISEVLRKRQKQHYPLFWVNPLEPKGDTADLLTAIGYSYIPCSGAAAFIREYLEVVERLKRLAPGLATGPALGDLELALGAASPTVGSLFDEYMDCLFTDFARTRPDFEKFVDYDDAIISQINDATPVIERFCNSVSLASRYRSPEAAQRAFQFFGRLLELCDVPEDFIGTYRETDFDGFRFCVYEMLVLLAAHLMKSDLWEIFGDVFGRDLYVESTRQGRYQAYSSFRFSVTSLDQARNVRLKVGSFSLTSDILNQRHLAGVPTKSVSAREFMEADYLLYLRSVLHDPTAADERPNLWQTWIPQSCVHLRHVPSYLVKAESARYLKTLGAACGILDTEQFKSLVAERYHHLWRIFDKRGRVGFTLDVKRLGGRA